MNNVVFKIHIHIFIWAMCYHFFHRYPGVELLCCMINIYLIFEERAKLFQRCYIILHSEQQHPLHHLVLAVILVITILCVFNSISV